MQVPFQSRKKVRKGNNVTAVESIIFETFPYTSSSAKDMLLFSKFLESFVREEKTN